MTALSTDSAARSAARNRRRSARLRRSDCSGPGLRRLRRGKGFVYLDERGERIEDAEAIDRLRSLAIPPAWKEVWICPDPLGHLQATGIDGAGRKQYLYHPRWREHRDREKFEKMVRFATQLPKLRTAVARDLADAEPTRHTVLACAVRLLDIGVFRIGSEEYADEESGIGLATIRKDHVTVRADEIEFDYPAKGGLRRRLIISDPVSLEHRPDPEAPAQRRTAPARLPRRTRLAPPALGRDQRLPQGEAGGGLQRQGLPDLECDRHGLGVARLRGARGQHQRGAQTGHRARGAQGRRAPR